MNAPIDPATDSAIWSHAHLLGSGEESEVVARHQEGVERLGSGGTEIDDAAAERGPNAALADTVVDPTDTSRATPSYRCS